MSTDHTKQADTVSRLDSHTTRVDPGHQKTLAACHQQGQQQSCQAQHLGWQRSEKIGDECSESLLCSRACFESAEKEQLLVQLPFVSEEKISDRIRATHVIKCQPTRWQSQLSLSRIKDISRLEGGEVSHQRKRKRPQREGRICD